MSAAAKADQQGLGKSIGYTVGQSIFAAVVGLALNIFLARALGTEGNGVLSLALLLPTLLLSLANLGICPATAYLVSRGDFPLRQVVRQTIAAGLALSLLLSLLGLGIVALASDEVFPGVHPTLLLVSLLILPPWLLLNHLTSVFHGLQAFRAYNLINSVAPNVTLMLTVAGVWLLDGGVSAALLAVLGGYFVALGASLAVLYYRLPPDDGAARPGFLAACLAYGWKAHVANLVAFLNYRLDMFLVNAFLNPAAVGIYAVAVLIAERLWLLSRAVTVVLFPLLSSLPEQNEERARITALAGRWILVTGLGSALVVAVVASWVIELIFGPAFLEAAEALRWLLPGVVLWGVAQVFTNDIAARGKPEINTYLTLVTLAVNVAANIVLIPRYGIVGASLASTISYSLLTVLILVVYCRLIGARITSVLLPNLQDVFLARRLLRIIPGLTAWL